jgi:ankyrin repeat protein
VQEDGSTALMVACESGHTDIVKLLLVAPGLDVNAANVSRVSGNACVCRHVVLRMVGRSCRRLDSTVCRMPEVLGSCMRLQSAIWRWWISSSPVVQTRPGFVGLLAIGFVLSALSM